MWNNMMLTILSGLNLLLACLVQQCAGAFTVSLYGYRYPAYTSSIPQSTATYDPNRYYHVASRVAVSLSNNPAWASSIVTSSVHPSSVPSLLSQSFPAGFLQNLPRSQSSNLEYRGYQVPLLDGTGPICRSISWPENICDDDGDYPLDMIKDILDENFLVQPTTTATESEESPIGNRGIHSDQNYGGCDAESKIIYPKVAKSTSEKWVYVANYKDYSQQVRVQKCSSSSESCSRRAQSTYTSTCQQKTERRTMIAIDIQRRKPYEETFEMPVECHCVVLSSVFPTRSNLPGADPTTSQLNRTYIQTGTSLDEGQYRNSHEHRARFTRH